LFLPDKTERVERLLLAGPEAELPLPEGLEAVVVNEGGHGFYRVRYGSGLMPRPVPGAAARPAGGGPLHPGHRALGAGRAGPPPRARFPAGPPRFRPERDRNVWSVLLGAFAVLPRLVEPVDRPRLEELIRDRLAPPVAELGWQPKAGEGDLTRQLRADLL